MPKVRGAEFLAHAEAGYHLARDVGGLFEVVAGSGGELVEYELLGGSPAHCHGEARLELVPGYQAAVLFGDGLGEAARLPASDYRYLGDRIGVGQHVGDEGMTGLVVGGYLLLTVAYHTTPTSGTGYDPVYSLGELRTAYQFLGSTSRQDRRFVHKVRKIGPTESNGLTSHTLQVNLLLQRLALGVNVQYLHPSLQVGIVQHNTSVETTGTQQSRIEDVGTVRGGYHYHVGACVEAVHLDQYLVQSLLTLVVASTKTRSTMTTHSVYLVHEHDARRVSLGLVEQVPNTAGSDSNEHLNELRAGYVEERDSCLSGNSAGHQRLSCPRRADQQHTLGYLRSKSQEPLRILEELDDLLELFLGLLHAGDVRETDLWGVAHEHSGLASTEAEGLVGVSLGLSHHEQKHGAEEYEGEEVEQQAEDG